MATTLSPEERSLRARLRAHSLHANHNPTETTAEARATFLATFEQQVDPQGILPEAERKRRAEHARKAHFLRMALKSADSRRAKAATRKGGAAA